MLKYMRYLMISALMVLYAGFMMQGGVWLWIGFLFVVVLIVGGDSLLGDDLSEPRYNYTWLLNLQLYSNLPILLFITVLLAWHVGPGDFLTIGQTTRSLTGWDILANREATETWHYIGAVLTIGLMYGAAGTNVGHELTHRTWSVPSQIVGRWLLAFTSDASFAIEHVYGHHKHVATRQDPATSRRGENAYTFVLRSTVMSYLHAWKIENERLKKLGVSSWSWRNRMHRGNLMTLAYVGLFYAAAGWPGALLFIGVSLYGKSYLEFINFVEHYGIVRVPGRPVEPRHSWNCNRRMSGFALYNLTRHSHHHAMGEKPFWELKAYQNAPMMPYGYLSMIYMAMVPPFWNKKIIPRVLEWDRKFASLEELPLIEEANRLSGIPAFSDEDIEALRKEKSAMKNKIPESFDYESGLSSRGDENQGNVGTGKGKSGGEDRRKSRRKPKKSGRFGLLNILGGSRSGAPRKATIQNLDKNLTVQPGDTLLGAALEAGVPFPHNCRVGGCGACKCRLVEGQVKEMTDSSYLLSRDEVREGYVLACQSIPRSDVVVEVPGIEELAARHDTVRTEGKITSLRPLTHDILELEILLNTAVSYTAGQFARISVPGVIEEARSYSFAASSKGRKLKKITFHVRLVEGGAFTNWLHAEATEGRQVEFEGPYGDFYLRPGASPLLLVGGGSGMAPLGALLEQAREDNLARDVIYLYGARSQKDLYCLEEMKELEAGWLSQFEFIPVLSAGEADKSWRGRRGMVTEYLRASANRLGDPEVYMCGPPPMIDAALDILDELGIDSIYFDKFVDKSHVLTRT